MIKKMFSLLNKMIPKGNIILFNSYPFYSDNSRYVYEYILRNREDITKNYRIYWISDDRIEANKSVVRHPTIKKKSVKGVWLFLRAKYVFATHGYFKDVLSPDSQYNINLWHGCGYKDNPVAEKGYRGNYNIVTSELYIKIHADLFHISDDRIIITGLPRNDGIFAHCHGLKDLGIDTSGYSKILLWLPTYRKASIGHNKTDGNAEQSGYRNLLTSYKAIDTILAEKGYLLLLKLHPLEESDSIQNINIGSNIRIIQNELMISKMVSVYDILSETNALISDYSSIITDYMLTGNPIVYMVGDFDEYKNNRGFVFDNIDEMMAGPIIKNAEEFQNYIRNFDEINSSYAEKREKLRSIFHKYIDGNSAQRVVEYFWGKEKQ